jgi:hypothetical protein
MALGDHAAHLDIDGSHAAEELLDRLEALGVRRPADAPASTYPPFRLDPGSAEPPAATDPRTLAAAPTPTANEVA